MRPRLLRTTAAFTLALGLGLTVEAAEPPPSADAAGEAGVSEGQAQEPMDAEAMLARARQLQVRIAQVADNLSAGLREARQNKDVVREVCLDDKLNQADVASETAQDRVSSMVAAIAAGDLATVQRDFVVVSALDESAQSLAAGGDRCLGEEQTLPKVLGQPLEVTFDPDIPIQETTGGALERPPFVLPPTVTIQPQLAVSRVM
jgi:hypothetical protein